MTLMIDDRVGAIEITTHITVEKELTKLQYADFAFLGNGPEGPVMVGVERKEIRDLLQSMVSGRLSGHQLEGLLNSYDYTYLLVEGLTKIDDNGYLMVRKGKGWHRLRMGDHYVTERYVTNYLNSLAVMCGIIVKFTISRKHSGMWLSSIYLWWQKDWDKHRSLNKMHQPPPPTIMGKFGVIYKPTLLHKMLAQIDGVGWEKGKAVAEAYETPMELMMADEKELRQLPGIGPKLAKKIITSLRGEE